eukprot:6213644-Pleurochrysis_carterae.AAC.5
MPCASPTLAARACHPARLYVDGKRQCHLMELKHTRTQTAVSIGGHTCGAASVGFVRLFSTALFEAGRLVACVLYCCLRSKVLESSAHAGQGHTQSSRVGKSFKLRCVARGPSDKMRVEKSLPRGLEGAWPPASSGQPAVPLAAGVVTGQSRIQPFIYKND